MAYQLLGSGFIGSASWTLAAVGAFVFALAILQYSRPLCRVHRSIEGQCIVARGISQRCVSVDHHEDNGAESPVFLVCIAHCSEERPRELPTPLSEKARR